MMTRRLKLLSAVASLSMSVATPVFAQAAIQEPGAYAFYHPNGDVVEANRSSRRQPAGAMAALPRNAGNAYAYMGDGTSASCSQRYRSFDPASGSFLGYDGLRHPCH
jgi:hypothetical protein